MWLLDFSGKGVRVGPCTDRLSWLEAAKDMSLAGQRPADSPYWREGERDMSHPGSVQWAGYGLVADILDQPGGADER